MPLGADDKPGCSYKFNFYTTSMSSFISQDTVDQSELNKLFLIYYRESGHISENSGPWLKFSENIVFHVELSYINRSLDTWPWKMV